MLNELELKDKLQAYAQNEFRPPEQKDLAELIPAMLDHIGSTDSCLRDHLIYSAFSSWILRYNTLNPDQLRNLLPIILDERHMLYKIGEQDTDSVFTRSFSILILPLLLIAHRSQPLFSAPEIHRIKDLLLYYLENEKDRRGFVDERGWADAISHTADALDDLAQCTEMNKADLATVLEAMRTVICFKSAGSVPLEEERMVTAVIAILRRDLLSKAEISQWIDGFSDLALAVNSMPEKFFMRANVKSFLQSLYFRLQWEQMQDTFDTSINDTLQRINPYIKYEGS